MMRRRNPSLFYTKNPQKKTEIGTRQTVAISRDIGMSGIISPYALNHLTTPRLRQLT